MDNYKLRLRFAKTGKAKYISHLDLMSTMQRVLIRAGVGLKYSQGFNPHPTISIALPLSVGCSSVCELIDFKTEHYLLPDGLPQIINDVLPKDIEVLEAYIPLRKFSAAKWVKVKGELHYNKAHRNIIEDLMNRFSMDNIIIEKKTKRGIKDIDIAPYIKNICYNINQNETECNGTNPGKMITISAMLSAQDPSINPQNMMSALSGEYKILAPDFAAFTRVEIYDADLNVFR